MAYIRKLKPSGRYQATVRFGGRRYYGPNPPARLKAEAEHWATETLRDLRRGEWRDPRLARVAFEEWFERWWQSRVVEPEGARNSRYLANNHVLSYWSGKPLASIGRLEVQTWVARMQRDGKGAPTIHKAYGLFRACLNAAVDEDLISRSPCRNISLPTVPKTLPRFYEVAEVATLVGELPPKHAEVALLMAWCGLRWEEAVAVEVGQVNMLRRTITVSQVVTSMRRIKAYSKGSADHRVVPAPPHVLEALTPSWQVAVASGAGPAFEGHRLLFPAAGQPLRPMSPQSWQMAWKRAHGRLAKRGRAVPYLPPHALRHTAASWWVQNGVDLYEVQRLLGHAKSDTTQIYAHLRPGVHRNVREAWDVLLSDGSDEPPDDAVTHISP